jgi:ATF/CREB family transcription factor
MFPMPEPSPNPIFNEMLGDAVTPGTRSFHETAFRQARRTQQATSHPSIDQTLQQGAHSMPGLSNGLTAMDVKPQVPQYDGQEAHEAVNGLYLLSQSSQAPNHHYSMAPHATIHAHAHPQNMPMENVPEAHMGHRPHASISTQGDGSPDMGDNSDDEPQSKKRKTRATAAKKTNTKTPQSNGAQKKAPAKGAGKRGKANNMDSASPEPEQEELDLSKAEYDANGKPCNDEEKRKNFLERNRYVCVDCMLQQD